MAAIRLCRLAAAWVILFSFFSDGRGQSPKRSVKIGMIDTLFQEKDERKIMAQMEPFANLVRKQTMTDGEFVVIRGIEEMGRRLASGKLQMAVVHGIEYGWLRDICPQCRPLLVAVNRDTFLQAHILVNANSDFQSLDDLKGKVLVLSEQVPYHARFYLRHAVPTDPDQFFQQKRVRNTDAAIEAVATGAADATLVSKSSFDVYQRRKPARARRFLRILSESPRYPVPLLVYKPGRVADPTLERFKQALLTAHENASGRQTLTLWRLSRFEPVPPDFESLVEDFLRRHPHPD